jgi:hypothetical protein
MIFLTFMIVTETMLLETCRYSNRGSSPEAIRPQSRVHQNCPLRAVSRIPQNLEVRRTDELTLLAWTVISRSFSLSLSPKIAPIATIESSSDQSCSQEYLMKTSSYGLKRHIAASQIKFVMRRYVDLLMRLCVGCVTSSTSKYHNN